MQSWLDNRQELAAALDKLGHILNFEGNTRPVRVGSLCTGAGTDKVLLDGINEQLAQRDDGFKAGKDNN